MAGRQNTTENGRYKTKIGGDDEIGWVDETRGFADECAEGHKHIGKDNNGIEGETNHS